MAAGDQCDASGQRRAHEFTSLHHLSSDLGSLIFWGGENPTPISHGLQTKTYYRSAWIARRGGSWFLFPCLLFFALGVSKLLYFVHLPRRVLFAPPLLITPRPPVTSLPIFPSPARPFLPHPHR